MSCFLVATARSGGTIRNFNGMAVHTPDADRRGALPMSSSTRSSAFSLVDGTQGISDGARTAIISLTEFADLDAGPLGIGPEVDCESEAEIDAYAAPLDKASGSPGFFGISPLARPTMENDPTPFSAASGRLRTSHAITREVYAAGVKT
jgi:hypothetical protein